MTYRTDARHTKHYDGRFSRCRFVFEFEYSPITSSGLFGLPGKRVFEEKNRIANLFLVSKTFFMDGVYYFLTVTSRIVFRAHAANSELVVAVLSWCQFFYPINDLVSSSTSTCTHYYWKRNETLRKEQNLTTVFNIDDYPEISTVDACQAKFLNLKIGMHQLHFLSILVFCGS